MAHWSASHQLQFLMSAEEEASSSEYDSDDVSLDGAPLAKAPRMDNLEEAQLLVTPA